MLLLPCSPAFSEDPNACVEACLALRRAKNTQRCRIWRKANPGKSSEYSRRCRARKKARIYKGNWRLANPGKDVIYSRRSRLNKKVGITLTVQ